MSMRYQAGILTASYFPLKVPNAPTAVTATMASSTSVSVAFTAPADVGGGAITGYTVVSSGGNIATGSSSPITVSGLTTGVAYTFVVYANNAFGNSPASAASNSVTPVTQGQQAYTTAGTYSWVAPAGVTSVSVVAVGGGGASVGTYGAGGGELRYKNNITVIPGNSYAVVVGAAGAYTTSPYHGGASSFNTSSCIANGGFGSSTGTGGSGGTGDGGGNGGNGAPPANSYGSGGGAGGYAGAGGNGSGVGSPTAGSGGGGGGGASYVASNYLVGGAGGGVGLLGQGSNGAAGTSSGGGGGSGGTAGSISGSYTVGGAYGGGGGSSNGSVNQGGNGGVGAVRIIWPGTTRSFPSTNTGDL